MNYLRILLVAIFITAITAGNVVIGNHNCVRGENNLIQHGSNNFINGNNDRIIEGFRNKILGDFDQLYRINNLRVNGNYQRYNFEEPLNTNFQFDW